jgi:hypothetical protein
MTVEYFDEIWESYLIEMYVKVPVWIVNVDCLEKA